MRYLVLFVALLAGCGTPKPPPPGTYSPLVAASLGVATTGESPQPTPTPAPAGKCENCNGTGKLGDGTVVVDCPVCGGDGRTDNEPTPEPEPVSVVVDPLAVPVADAECADGTCETPALPGQSAPQRALVTPAAAPKPTAAPATQYEAPRRRIFRGRLFGRGGGGA